MRKEARDALSFPQYFINSRWWHDISCGTRRLSSEGGEGGIRGGRGRTQAGANRPSDIARGTNGDRPTERTPKSDRGRRSSQTKLWEAMERATKSTSEREGQGRHFTSLSSEDGGGTDADADGIMDSHHATRRRIKGSREGEKEEEEEEDEEK